MRVHALAHAHLNRGCSIGRFGEFFSLHQCCADRFNSRFELRNGIPDAVARFVSASTGDGQPPNFRFSAVSSSKPHLARHRVLFVHASHFPRLLCRVLAKNTQGRRSMTSALDFQASDDGGNAISGTQCASEACSPRARMHEVAPPHCLRSSRI